MLYIKQQTSSSVVSKQPVPLKEIHVDARVHSFAADVTLTQLFQNDECTPIEAVYCFPVEENAAIYAFIAQIDDELEIVAELKEKKMAQQEYTQAIAQGHGAYLFEQNEESNDVFVVSVGALKPGSKCRITISYVSELDLLHGSEKPTIRFVIPTTIAPRYSPALKSIVSPGETQVKYTESVPYFIEFSCHVDKLSQYVTCVASPSHPIKVDTSNEETFLVTLSQQGVELDRDIIIDIDLSQNRTNKVAAIGKDSLMVSFMPNEEDCRQNTDNVTNEFLFVIDCSGSMEDENKIGLARKAMLLFLKSLPVHCHFNIIRFGSSFASLFRTQATDIYNEKNMHQAESLINNIKADLGGTELLGPLVWLNKNKPQDGCMRQIFLLTDGEVSNVNEVTSLCREMASHTRIFSFGLGHSPSRALVKGLARATNGHFAFIPPNTSVNVYVAEQLAHALHSNITNVSAKWNTSQTVLYSVPEQASSVYVGNRLIFYALLDDSMPVEDATTVELVSKQHQQSLGVIDIKHHTLPTFSPQSVTRLAVKALFRELLHKSTTPPKELLISLSIKYGILCPYTAFIGVERRLNTDSDSNANMELREVAIMQGPTDRRRTWQSPRSFCQLQNDVDAITCVMKSNLNKVLERDNTLSMLIARSDCLQCSSPQFYRKASRSARKRAFDVGSIFQPIFSFASSLFTRKSVDSQTSTISITANRSQEALHLDWPADEQQLVERFIERQQYDGLWMLTENDVSQLTGKSLTAFSSPSLDLIEKSNQQVLITTALVLVILETRCVSSKTLWQTLTNKAHKRMIELLGGHQPKLEQLMKDIRDQLL